MSDITLAGALANYSLSSVFRSSSCSEVAQALSARGAPIARAEGYLVQSRILRRGCAGSWQGKQRTKPIGTKIPKQAALQDQEKSQAVSEGQLLYDRTSGAFSGTFFTLAQDARSHTARHM